MAMMVNFTTVILKFAEQGEKTGWTYINVSADMAQQLNPGNKKSFRVKGFLDSYPIEGIALIPMGNGDFIMAFNAEMRKGIHKKQGAVVQVKLELHADFSIPAPPELLEYLEMDQDAAAYFNSLAKSHREYFFKWINSAKTQATREKRLVNVANAMSQRLDYGQMIRSLKSNRYN